VPTFLSDVLAQGRWDHRKGASIKTFFIGWCVMQFRNVFRKFLREHHSEFIQHADLGDKEHDRSGGGNPALILTANETRAELLAQIPDETTRAILVLRADGYGNAEIADLLEVTVGVVESRLYRWKRDHHTSGVLA
jgi:DNA-directed RNA polymerase specialized sigma24 family protein